MPVLQLSPGGVTTGPFCCPLGQPSHTATNRRTGEIHVADLVNLGGVLWLGGTAEGVLDRTCGERPRASRIGIVPRLDLPED